MVGSGLAIFETPENSAAVRTSLGTSPAIGNAEDARGNGAVLESVRVLDVSDPAHPRAVQNFDGVTSFLHDSAQLDLYRERIRSLDRVTRASVTQARVRLVGRDVSHAELRLAAHITN
jgi:hypothetical protein